MDRYVRENVKIQITTFQSDYEIGAQQFPHALKFLIEI